MSLLDGSLKKEYLKESKSYLKCHFFPPYSLAGLTEWYGHKHDVLARIPASNDLRDGSDLGLIPDVEWKVDCRVGL